MGDTKLSRDFIEAAMFGDIKTVCALLDKDKDKTLVECFNEDGNTALINAAFTGQLPMVKLLVGEGAQVEKANKEGLSALHRAAWNGHIEVARYLIKEGANVNSRSKLGETPLFVAARQGHTQAARWLLRMGAYLGVKTKYGTTVLEASKNNSDTFEMLKNYNDFVFEGKISDWNRKEMDLSNQLSKAKRESRLSDQLSRGISLKKSYSSEGIPDMIDLILKQSYYNRTFLDVITNSVFGNQSILTVTVSVLALWMSMYAKYVYVPTPVPKKEEVLPKVQAPQTPVFNLFNFPG